MWLCSHFVLLVIGSGFKLYSKMFEPISSMFLQDSNTTTANVGKGFGRVCTSCISVQPRLENWKKNERNPEKVH